jgi:hypothetical protein
MKKTLAILGLAFSMTACNLINSEIDREKVNVDDSTKVYTYKDNNKKVSGTVVFYELDPKTAKKYKKSVREVKDGKRINKGYDYFPSGSIAAEYPYDANGLITGTVKYFYENGQLYATVEFKDNKKQGVAKEFREDGTQAKETIYDLGKKTKEYDFDDSGKKIIPAIERLELVKYETGFYEYKDFNSYQLLYQPMVIMKWKNISNEPLSEKIEMEAIFIDNSKGEEWSKSSDYFQGYSDAPLQPGLSRQSSLQSSVGFTSKYGIYNADISCQIFINKKLYKTVKIKNDFLTSNRIQ